MKRLRIGYAILAVLYGISAVICCVVTVMKFIDGDPIGWLWLVCTAVWSACTVVWITRIRKKETNVDPQEVQRRVNSMFTQSIWSAQWPVPGGYRGTAQAHRAGAVGGPVSGAANGAGAGARPSMTIIDEFSGRDRIIAPVMEEAGFAVGVLRGTRSFLVDKYGRLTGVTYQQVWTPGENIANCRRNDTYDALTFAIWAHGSQMVRSSRPEPEPHPLRDCRHGFYGYYDGSDDYHKEGMISGVVEGFGECVVGTRGFRSMKARIVALHIPDDVPAHVRRMIARNYKDTPILDSFEQMVAEFPTDSAGAEYTPENDPEFWTRES